MQKKLCGLPAIMLLAAVAALSTLPHAHAVVLESKWQAGQQLSYDVKLNGTMRFMAPAEMPMIGGLPLEVLLIGDGQSTLDTREVDEFGSAVVVPRLERLQVKMNETTFNQTGVLGIRDGRANFSFNGQNVASDVDVNSATNPNHGLRITRHMRVVGVQRLEEREEPAAGDAPVGRELLPANMTMLIQAMITRAIPPFLPSGDVNIGDTWDAVVQMPALPGAVPTTEPPGKFEFRAVGEEEVLGRKTWRIAVDGVMQIRELSTAVANQAIEQRRAQGDRRIPAIRLPNLVSLTQNMKGDVWFDPVAGQLVRANLRLDSVAEGRAAAGRAVNGNMDFNGTLQMDLRKLSYTGGE